jgi:hypothetical protein
MICKWQDFCAQLNNKPCVRCTSYMRLISWICPSGSETSTYFGNRSLALSKLSDCMSSMVLIRFSKWPAKLYHAITHLSSTKYRFELSVASESSLLLFKRSKLSRPWQLEIASDTGWIRVKLVLLFFSSGQCRCHVITLLNIVYSCRKSHHLWHNEEGDLSLILAIVST